MALCAFYSWAEEPSSLSDRHQSAVKLAREGNLKEALPLMESVYQQKPLDPTVVADYIVLLTWAERWSKAVAVYEQKKELKLPDYVLPQVGRAYVEQGQLRQAQKYVRHCLDNHPDDIELRSLLAQIYLWRGWFRLALKEFEEIHSQAPKHALTNNGYANALNATHHKQQAREFLQSLLNADPTNGLYLKTQKEFNLEKDRTLGLRSYDAREYPGEDEFYFSTSLNQPVGYEHTLFAEYIRREISQNPKNNVSEKVYIGDQWIPNGFWKGKAAVSFDPDTGQDAGGLGKMEVTPDDRWLFQTSYDSKIIDVPLRSQTAGTDVTEYECLTRYRLSDLFHTTLGINFKDYTDGNENLSYFWYTETGLYRRIRWKMNLKTESYLTTNSEQGVPYYSPKYVYSLYLIPEIEHTWFRHEDQALVDRLSVGPGQLWQKGFDANTVGFVRYEQDYQLSKKMGLLGGAAYSLHNYDGDSSKRWNIYTAVKIRF